MSHLLKLGQILNYRYPITFNLDNFYIASSDKGVKVKDSDAEAAVRIENGDLVMINIQFADNASGFVSNRLHWSKSIIY